MHILLCHIFEKGENANGSDLHLVEENYVIN
jgi:hypothetical protein